MANTLIDGLQERISNAIKINRSVGIILPGNNYADLMQALFERMKSRAEDAWVYVAITRPYEDVVKQFGNFAELRNVRFIDCISHAAGISKIDPNCTFIESPALLEKLMMEIMDTFRGLDDSVQKYLVIDSLSSLLIYNDAQIVTEFFTHLTNRTRLADVHTITLVVEEESSENINKIIYLRSDKIIKVRESFI